MPQISPISWTLVILLFLMSTFTIFSSLSSSGLEKLNPSPAKELHKKMKW